MKKTKKNYINNETFCEELMKYKEKVKLSKETGLPVPKIPNYIGECFYLIAEKLATKPEYSGYSYIDEMKGDGIENCIMYFHNFDTGKSKYAFAYFTQIIMYAFWRRIEKEKKQQYIKHKNMENSFIHDEIVDSLFHDRHDITFVDMNHEKTNNFVEEFEQRLEDKKKKINKEVLGIEKFLKHGEDDVR